MEEKKFALRTPTLFLVLFIFSTVTHVVAGHWWRESSVLDVTGEDGKVASSLAETGRFADLYVVLPPGPTAVIAPGYPYLLSGVIRVFELGNTGRRAIHCLPSQPIVCGGLLCRGLRECGGLPTVVGLSCRFRESPLSGKHYSSACS
jgi:hypothetical protein